MSNSASNPAMWDSGSSMAVALMEDRLLQLVTLVVVVQVIVPLIQI